MSEPACTSMAAAHEGGSDRKGKYKFKITVDSGASENVLPKDWFPDVPTKPSKGSEEGQYWISAKGGKIYNLGEKEIEFETEEGHKWKVKWQVADVTKPLLSGYRLTEKGNTVVLAKEQSWIQNAKQSKTKIKREGKVFTMHAWSKVPVFAGQGR